MHCRGAARRGLKQGAGRTVNRQVTPETIATSVRQGNILRQIRLSRFTAQPRNGGAALAFERCGLGWTLGGFDLPASGQN